MKKQYYLFLLLTMVIVNTACSEKDLKPPRVVETFPHNGSTNVDSSINEISVTFDVATLTWSLNFI